MEGKSITNYFRNSESNTVPEEISSRTPSIRIEAEVVIINHGLIEIQDVMQTSSKKGMTWQCRQRKTKTGEIRFHESLADGKLCDALPFVHAFMHETEGRTRVGDRHTVLS